jgi:hypothetical protein
VNILPDCGRCWLKLDSASFSRLSDIDNSSFLGCDGWQLILRIDHIGSQLIVIPALVKARQTVNYKSNYEYKDQT